MEEIDNLYFCVTYHFLGDMQDCMSIISVTSAHMLSYVNNSDPLKHAIQQKCSLKAWP